MAFDSFSLHYVTKELRQTIADGQIRHIEQINATDIVLKISASADVSFLLLSAHSVHARAHLVSKPARANNRSHFADFLMKHLIRGTIRSIEQVGLDRILYIDIEPRGVLETAPKRLIGEFMGKHSNLILIDSGTGKILESIKHVDDEMSRRRQVLPGLSYQPPPAQAKHDPFKLSQEEFTTIFEDSSQRDAARAILRHVDGFSPLLAKEVVLRASPDGPVTELWDAYQSLLGELGSPHIFVDGKKMLGVAPLRLHLGGGQPQPFETMSQALDHYHEQVITQEHEVAQRQALLQALEKRGAGTEEKITALEMEMERAENAEEYRIQGELINANLHRIKRGQTQVTVQNYYEPDTPDMVIELEPSLLPAQNAQQYFKRYSKAKRGKSILANLISDQEANVERLRHYREMVDSATGLEAQMQVRQEFISAGLLTDPQKHRKKSAEEKSFRRYTSSNGFSIYVGRSTKENDLLTLKIARKHDIWLHAKQIPGSHVIIRNPERKEQIPMPTLLEAARAAAFFSRSGKSENVPVDYTSVRYVTKPKGSAPGYVHYTHEKTLFVDPERPKGRD